MFKLNNSIVPNKMRIGWHFSSNKYAYRDAYSALKSMSQRRWHVLTDSAHIILMVRRLGHQIEISQSRLFCSNVSDM